MALGDGCAPGCRFAGQEKHPAQCEPRGTVSASGPCGCGHPSCTAPVAREAVCCEPDCLQPANWELRDGTGPDDYTHACDGHIGSLLRPDVETFVRHTPKDSLMRESARLPFSRSAAEAVRERARRAIDHAVAVALWQVADELERQG